MGADSCNSDGDLRLCSGVSRRRSHARLIALWSQSCSGGVCVCLCVCLGVLSVCEHRRPHTRGRRTSAWKADVPARRRSGGVSRGESGEAVVRTNWGHLGSRLAPAPPRARAE